jgi:hypothetical protein
MVVFTDKLAEGVFSHSPSKHESIQIEGNVIIIDPGYADFCSKSPRRGTKTSPYI